MLPLLILKVINCTLMHKSYHTVDNNQFSHLLLMNITWICMVQLLFKRLKLRLWNKVWIFSSNSTIKPHWPSWVRELPKILSSSHPVINAGKWMNGTDYKYHNFYLEWSGSINLVKLQVSKVLVLHSESSGSGLKAMATPQLVLTDVNTLVNTTR